MNVYNISFSPTGGTRRVAELLCAPWGDAVTPIDLLPQNGDWSTVSFAAEDLCIVAAPSFGGRVPAPAVERLSRMQGNGARAVLAAVYGNRAIDDTLLELQEVLEGAGFCCVAAVSAVAEHSIFRQVAAGRPDKADQEELLGFARKIQEKIQQGGDVGKLTVPGHSPYREYNGVPFKPKAGWSCTKCGTCAKECPVGAIPKDAPKSVDKDTCISCMRCIAVCPKGARKNPKLMLSIAASKMKPVFAGRKENALYL